MTNFDTIKIAEKNKNFVELDVWLGKKKTVKGYIKKDLYKTIPKAEKIFKSCCNLSRSYISSDSKDQKLAKLKLSYKDEILDELDIFAIEEVKKLTFFQDLLNQ